MKICFFIFFVFTVIAFQANAQQIIRKGDTIKCNENASAKNFDASSRTGSQTVWSIVPKPNSSGRKQGGTSQFEVKFIGFPANAQAAVEKAIEIWSATLKSGVKIRIFANWTVLQSPGTLAFVVPTEVRNFSGNPNPNLWYPMALAEKLVGRDINPDSEADIVATFNAGRTDWYFGLDGQAGSNYDLVTIALHEIGHGLGFSPTFRVNSNLGSVGSSDGNPKIYDSFIFNGNNESLLNQSLFPNSSFQLGAQLTGGSLNFKSEIAKSLNAGGSFPRIFAPNPYNPGSSISHLDETQYNNTKNKLMTPFVGPGEFQHDVGPLVRGIFYEIGWLNTTLSHQDIGDQETFTGKKFNLQINSDTLINTSSIKFFYSFDNFATSNMNVMNIVSGSLFESEILNPPSEKTVSYYFTANDVFGRQYRYPQSQNVTFYLGIDTKKPVVTHTPISDITEFDTQLQFLVSAVDNIGIKRVFLEYQINTGATQTQDFVNIPSSNNFTYTLNLTTLVPRLKQGDKITYRMIAVDNSSQQNVTSFPSVGSITVNVRTFPARQTYVSDFSADPKDFFGDFAITTPIGFTNGAIHSTHPYGKSLILGSFIDASYILLYPIQIKDKDSYIEFDEVVLIDPNADTGDFVIVEGSRDKGNTWVAVTDFYTSTKNTDWLTYYNSDIQGGDSKAIGTLNFYRKNKIDLLSKFSAGDLVNIRFRLRSDSQRSGWGWAIDNLKIQDQVVGLQDNQNELFEETRVFPNPFSKSLVVELPKSQEEVTIKIVSLLGHVVDSQRTDHSIVEFDTTHLGEGIFVLQIESKEFDSFKRKIVKKGY